MTPYRGRIAPSPTGFLHLGHAATFRTAWRRAREACGHLLFRMEDLDGARCRDEFRTAAGEDLRWLGLDWDEGPDMGGPCAPYIQSERMPMYRQAWEMLCEKGLVYPCRCSRRDIRNALSAPHEGDEEPIYPGTCRPPTAVIPEETKAAGVNWRFRVPENCELAFDDGRLGRQTATCGRDFGDFVVWRRDDIPSYQLAVTADDAAMRITEVVRGADLLVSTFRQLLLFEALGHLPPSFYHCSLIRDDGRRLAKRHGSLSLRTLRESGLKPEELHRKIDSAEFA